MTTLKMAKQVDATLPASTPVIAESYWDPAFSMPVFEENDYWDLNGLGTPPNQGAKWGRIHFTSLQGEWNLLAREAIFYMLNPSHKALRSHSVHVRRTPFSPSTARGMLPAIRALQEYANATGLPCDFRTWTAQDLTTAMDTEAITRTQNSRKLAADSMRRLEQLGPALTAGPFPAPVWTPQELSSMFKKGNRRTEIKTKPIDPEIWKALLNAAAAYVLTFSKDILAALDTWEELRKGRLLDLSTASPLNQLQAWLGNGGKIPMHSQHPDRPNYSLLAILVSRGRAPGLFGSHTLASNASVRTAIQAAIDRGDTRVGGLGVDCSPNLASGIKDPWHEDFDGWSLGCEIAHLRTACYVLVAAFSLMRDSEVQEIQRGSITSYFGAPAIKTRLRKGRPDRPTTVHWVHDSVVRAVEIAERLSGHATHIFATTRASTRNGESGSQAGMDAPRSIDRFVRHVNKNSERTGLETINTSTPIRPHQFRRTMAVIIGNEPGAELVLGIVLKHAGIRAISATVTSGYAVPDDAWKQEFKLDQLDAAMDRVIDEWLADPIGLRAAAGPGAEKHNQLMDSVMTKPADSASYADRSTLKAILRASNADVRFGPLNVCLGDRSVAKCVSPGTQDGLDSLNCRPATCANSVITQDQLPIWKAELEHLKKLKANKSNSNATQQTLEQRINEVAAVVGSKKVTRNV